MRLAESTFGVLLWYSICSLFPPSEAPTVGPGMEARVIGDTGMRERLGHKGWS